MKQSKNKWTEQETKDFIKNCKLYFNNEPIKGGNKNG